MFCLTQKCISSLRGGWIFEMFMSHEVSYRSMLYQGSCCFVWLSPLLGPSLEFCQNFEMPVLNVPFKDAICRLRSKQAPLFSEILHARTSSRIRNSQSLAFEGSLAQEVSHAIFGNYSIYCTSICGLECITSKMHKFHQNPSKILRESIAWYLDQMRPPV